MLRLLAFNPRTLQADGDALEWPRLQRTADSVGCAVGEDKSEKVY